MEEIKIDGIPKKDYGTPNSRTTYSETYNEQLKTFTNKEDLNKAMKDKIFEISRKKLDKMCEEYAEQLLKESVNADLTAIYMNGFYDGEKKLKDKIREKIKEYLQNGMWEHQNAIDFILEELLEE